MIMDKSIVSTFSFLGYSVDYIHYEANPKFKKIDNLQTDLTIDLKTTVSEELFKGQVTIIAKLFMDKMENYPFRREISLTGMFSMSETTDVELLRKCIKINGTTALFPFLRSIVADITKSANVQPLVMPLLNINRLIEQQEKSNK
jgi:preprotein translocase subunit SecB